MSQSTTEALRSSKASRWVWIISSATILGVGLVLSFLLSEATNNRQFFEQHYQWLFWVNMGVAALAGPGDPDRPRRLGLRLARGKFGSRLLLKLAGIFALVGLLPGLVIYTVLVPVRFPVHRKLVRRASRRRLDAGLALGRGTLDTLVADLGTQTRRAAEQLAESPARQQVLALSACANNSRRRTSPCWGPTDRPWRALAPRWAMPTWGWAASLACNCATHANATC